ncbi:HPP family protein [Marinomonas posidonica]|uniref:HPP family protein n=1 Tax=Marinomonas posidonica TaxID=936476 RepID=UPI0037350D6F
MKHFLASLLAGIGAFTGILCLAYFDHSVWDATLLMAPFGATAVLVFGLPKSPLAQAKNVIFGHLITAFIGVFFVQYVGVGVWQLALASGLGVTSMLFTKTTHPPAGANPILIMLSGQSWLFLLTPVLAGSIIIVLLGKVVREAQTRLSAELN